ncbi:MAG: hypothetical protein SWJ54_19335, partial [Cyanobacteriota bacterium]|nr:hypothetical protein [Cyanobacteriota bacterium]
MGKKKKKPTPARIRGYLKSYPQALIRSGNIQDYYKLLTDFNFLKQKIEHPVFGVRALIEDYHLIAEADTLDESQWHPEHQKVLRWLQRTLELSAHILHHNPTQLAPQLWGRLLPFQKYTAIQNLLETARQCQTRLWLRPIIPNLTPPGGTLVRTLSGHKGGVTAVAIS